MDEQRVSDERLSSFVNLAEKLAIDSDNPFYEHHLAFKELLERRAQRCETCYFQARFSYPCPIRDAWEYFANDEVMLRPAESFACDRWEAKEESSQ